MTAALLFFMALHPTVQLLLLVVFLLLIGWLLYHLFDDGAVHVSTPPPVSPRTLAKILDADDHDDARALYGYAPRSFAKPAAKELNAERRKDLGNPTGKAS